jgi:ectoine hydroxylase
MKIEEEKISFYKKNGYLILNGVLKKKDLIICKERLEQLVHKQKKEINKGLSEPGVEKSLLHSLHKDPIIKSICEDTLWFQKYSRKLLGNQDFVVWNAKSNLKRRWHGSCEYYHQDFSYWKKYGFKSSNMMSCMIFPDDHSHYNGGMWVFSGSHQKLYEHIKFLNINSLQKNLIPTKVLDRLSKKYPPIKLNIKAGSCLFFDCKLIHGSAHNISPIDRRIILYQLSSKKDYNIKSIKKINLKNLISRKKFEKKEIQKTLNTYN